MQKYKNYVRVTNSEEQKVLKLVLHPDKHYLDELVATDLFIQFRNSSCFKTKIFPCVLNLDENIDSVMQAYTSYYGDTFVQKGSSEQMDFLIQPYVAHLSHNNTLHHEHLVEAVSDLFDGILMYY